ncbi:MAG: radical SAM protein, partial [Candidatus Methanoperedens sp.]|nr:radical SAM protein [Candidatus Methanoperedens sp.]
YHKPFLYFQHSLQSWDFYPRLSTGEFYPAENGEFLTAIDTLENKNIDYIVKGEGEITFPVLLNALKNKNIFYDIKGIGYKDTSGIHINDASGYVDLNIISDLPYYLLDMNKYIAKRDGFQRCLTLETSRGCPYNCGFCSNPLIHKRKWRSLNVDNIIKKTNYLQDQFNLDGIIFQEDNFFVNTERIKEFCGKIGVNGIGWKANCRIKYLLDKDQHFLKMLENAGCKMLQFGVESGSNRVLNLLNKGITIEDIIVVNKKLAKTNILCRYNFIVGMPTETEEEIKKTLRFIDKLRNENANLDLPFLNIYTPWPGTNLFNLAVKNGFKPPDSLEGWSKFNWNSYNLPWLNERISKFLEEKSIKYRNENQYFLSYK